jgi:hypothetical protein
MLDFSLLQDVELDGKKIEKSLMLKLEGLIFMENMVICSGGFDASKGSV